MQLERRCRIQWQHHHHRRRRSDNSLGCLHQTFSFPTLSSSSAHLAVDVWKRPWSYLCKIIWITMHPLLTTTAVGTNGHLVPSQVTKDTDSIHADSGPSACDSFAKVLDATNSASPIQHTREKKESASEREKMSAERCGIIGSAH